MKKALQYMHDFNYIAQFGRELREEQTQKKQFGSCKGIWHESEMLRPSKGTSKASAECTYQFSTS